MHIVHKMENQYSGPNVKNGSQFSNGVLGFVFKCMPDSYFDDIKKNVAPEHQHTVDFHDRFLADLVDTESRKVSDAGKQKSFFSLKTDEAKEEKAPLDMHEFVELLDFNRRWTYQGSLTTIPCSEGILWNVIDHVIPIRQSTLDKYNQFRKIEEA